MKKDEHVELSLELGSGGFRLHLDGLVLNVTVKPHPQPSEESYHLTNLPAAASEKANIQFATDPETAEYGDQSTQLAEELDYYRQASQEIYESLGKLAKEINISLQDFTLAEIIQTNQTSPGERLDQARDQVADILQMTEKATMNILELVEQIQDDCLSVQDQLSHLVQTPDPALDSSAAPGPPDLKNAWSHLLNRGADLDQWLHAILPSLSGGSPPAQARLDRPHFPLQEVIQIVLEFCGNETVKQHLRSVQAQQDAVFDTNAVELQMSRLAQEVPLEDGFYQFPVDQVLNLLKEHARDERVKGLLTKMIGSAGKIFPMPGLPLEGHLPGEAEPSEEAVLDAPEPELLSHWQEFWQELQHLSAQATTAPHPSPDPQDTTSAAVAQEALTTVDRITSSLSRITEALAFQDLSGQRLLKVLGILKQLQIQVLTLLVAAGYKLKIRMDRQELEFKEHEIQAQEELDRILHNLRSDGPENQDAPVVPDDRPLDQDAINDLLSSMGF